MNNGVAPKQSAELKRDGLSGCVGHFLAFVGKITCKRMYGDTPTCLRALVYLQFLPGSSLQPTQKSLDEQAPIAHLGKSCRSRRGLKY